MIGILLHVLVVVAGFTTVNQTSATALKPIRVAVRVAQSEGPFLPLDQKDREDSATDLRRALRSRLPSFAALTNDEQANVVVVVIGRRADDDERVVWLRLEVGTQIVEVNGTDDDADWSDAAADAAKKIGEWIRLNRDRIVKATETPSPGTF